MYGKLYENDKVHNGYPTDYIYCSVCDSLVFIPGTGYNPRIYHNSHLKRCISGNTISNDHARRKEILQSIDRREFQIWQYKQYILQEEAKINRLRLKLFNLPHTQKRISWHRYHMIMMGILRLAIKIMHNLKQP